MFLRNFAAFLTLFFLISCSNNTSQNIDYKESYEKELGGEIINAMIGEPSNLIAMIAGDSASSAIAGNIFNTLIKYDENLELEPELAQSWSISMTKKQLHLL